MTLRLHISDHNDDLHNTTAKRNLAGGVAGLDASGDIIGRNSVNGLAGLNSDTKIDREHIYSHISQTEFMNYTPTGTAQYPHFLTDGNNNSVTIWNNLNEYVEILFNRNVIIYEYNYQGYFNQNTDGFYKIQYLHNGIWTDNTTIPTKVEGWTGWLQLDKMIGTTGIRIAATTMDSNGKNYLRELYIKGI